MKIYFIDNKPDGTTSLFSGDMADRHKIWVSNPNAKEISRKEYNMWIEYLKKHQNLITPLKLNK